MIKLSSIKNNPNNPRTIDKDKLEKLKKSIKAFEKMLELRPMVVDENNVLLGGNMRKRALKELGYKEIQESWVVKASDLTEEQKNEFIIKDNVGFGSWDWETLANEWDEQQLEDWGLDIPGFDADEQHLEAEEDDFEVAEQMQVDVVLGDLIEFVCEDGRVHRLICGDSTDSDVVARLMDGEKAGIAFTSPPYNAGKSEALSGNTHSGDNKYQKYNDDKNTSDYLDLLFGFTNNCLMFAEYLVCNIQSLAGNKVELIEYLYEYKNQIIDIAIWDKLREQPAMASNVLNSRFEFLYFISPNNKATRAIPNADFRGTISNVYQGQPNTSNEFSKHHAATFPLHLPEFILNAFTKQGTIVLESFGGTGTTKVAAHQLNRICYSIELDEKYCQVIIDRMQALDETIVVKINGKEYKKVQADDVPF